MKILTEEADLRCAHHNGVVDVTATQSLVTVDGLRVMVERDPEGRGISGCPNAGPTIKPCTATLGAQVGYSTLLTVEGRRVCLDTVSGLTDGTPPGVVRYRVLRPGQDWIDQE